jgi:biotin transport system substrate-specific component
LGILYRLHWWFIFGKLESINIRANKKGAFMNNQKMSQSALSVYELLCASSWGVRSAVIALLSWVFALCAQCIIPLPWNCVPVYPHPLPLFLTTLWLREYAMYAYGAYLVQGALGLPFFARAASGVTHIFGPTGGYLIGFLFAMSIFSKLVAMNVQRAGMRAASLILCAGVYFLSGLVWLSLFVPQKSLLMLGLYPFLLGDGIKLLIVFMCWREWSYK